jgi:hypothetical protein
MDLILIVLIILLLFGGGFGYRRYGYSRAEIGPSLRQPEGDSRSAGDPFQFAFPKILRRAGIAAGKPAPSQQSDQRRLNRRRLQWTHRLSKRGERDWPLPKKGLQSRLASAAELWRDGKQGQPQSQKWPR